MAQLFLLQGFSTMSSRASTTFGSCRPICMVGFLSKDLYSSQSGDKLASGSSNGGLSLSSHSQAAFALLPLTLSASTESSLLKPIASKLAKWFWFGTKDFFLLLYL